jgi:hypothetical protein
MRNGLKENKLHVPLKRIYSTSGSRLTDTATGYVENDRIISMGEKCVPLKNQTDASICK